MQWKSAGSNIVFLDPIEFWMFQLKTELYQAIFFSLLQSWLDLNIALCDLV